MGWCARVGVTDPMVTHYLQRVGVFAPMLSCPTHNSQPITNPCN